MMINENFLQRLIFYDKDHIPEDIFEALKEYVNHPQFQVRGRAALTVQSRKRFWCSEFVFCLLDNVDTAIILLWGCERIRKN